MYIRVSHLPRRSRRASAALVEVQRMCKAEALFYHEPDVAMSCILGSASAEFVVCVLADLSVPRCVRVCVPLYVCMLADKTLLRVALA